MASRLEPSISFPFPFNLLFLSSQIPLNPLSFNPLSLKGRGLPLPYPSPGVRLRCSEPLVDPFWLKSVIQAPSQKTPKIQHLTNHQTVAQWSPKLPQKLSKSEPLGVKKIPEPKLQEKVPTSIITTIYNTLAMFAMLKYLRI